MEPACNMLRADKRMRTRIFGERFRGSEMHFTSREVRRILSEGIGFLFPPRCPICDDLMEPGQEICIWCRREVQTVTEPVCKRCGKQLGDDRREYCSDCARKNHTYRQGKAVFVYRGSIRQSMYRFKYSNRREYAAFYAKEAAKRYRTWVEKKKIEVIVPIPMYPGKKRRRGYNQAEVFARALGRELGIPVERGLVKRVKDTVPQKELNDKERRHNLKNAFQLASDIVKYRQILLVDDIYTTGSTMDAVAEVLLSGGAERIYYICISIGAGF